ncbi:MAG TPA: tetraprenyl-beta-curcumene synthase family protein [Clostridiaceae bacterium]|nr:tetraprenyl-beta-curcumene synthase family protein [Clostridiaceae bacterium]
MQEEKHEKKYDYGLKLIYKFVRYIFPEVERQLRAWTLKCMEAEDDVLREQALSSIRHKKFHAQGGSIYALYPGVDMKRAASFIVSFQTISDYLDNLCDRTHVKSEPAFRQLHLAMLDAVDKLRGINNYYYYYPYKKDGSYLSSLVETCQEQISGLSSYNLVIEPIKKYVHLYSDLQAYKHLDSNIREECLKTWAEYYAGRYPDISWWEFSAAAGSTLGIFALFAASFNPGLTVQEVKAIEQAYFPWICGLHILLDYYIDSQEDLQTGDLNFTQYYKNLKQCEERIGFFVKRSFESCSGLSFPEFHKTIIRGLLAMYLSDPKAHMGLNNITSRNILLSNGRGTVMYHKLCKALRVAGAL